MFGRIKTKTKNQANKKTPQNTKPKNSMNCAILLSRRKNRKRSRQHQTGLHEKQCGKAPASEGGCWYSNRLLPPSQPVAFECLKFAASFISRGPAKLIAKWQGMPSWEVGRKYQGWVKKGLVCCWGEGMAFWSMHALISRYGLLILQKQAKGSIRCYLSHILRERTGWRDIPHAENE